jgi:hypothetical protein
VQLTLDGSRASPAPAAAELAQFFAKVVIDPWPGGCHHWIGAIGDDGYGRFQSAAGRSARAVRPHLRVFELSPTGCRSGCRCCTPATRPAASRWSICGSERRRRTWRRCAAAAAAAAGTTSVVDLRGPAGRARAIRAALAGGWDQAAFTAAVAAGNPFSDQLALPVAPAVPTKIYRAGFLPASPGV